MVGWLVGWLVGWRHAFIIIIIIKGLLLLQSIPPCFHNDSKSVINGAP